MNSLWNSADAATQNVASILADAAVKSAILLTVTLLITTLMRRRSAAALHRGWTLGLAGCLLVPLVSLMSPGWTPPLVSDSLAAVPAERLEPAGPPAPQPLHQAETRLPETQSPLASSPISKRAIAEGASVPPPDLALDPDADAAAPAGPQENPRHAESDSTAMVWVGGPAAWLLGIWLIGVSFCLLRAFWRRRVMLQMLKDCFPIDDDRWHRLLEDAARSLELNRRVRLLKFGQAQSPICTGALRASIVIPADSDHWDESRRRLVLLHELAHVKRYDVLTQTIAELVCAALWFNPICWIGKSQMRRLRELACDDLVI
ncbi:MAG: M56 family metallopeptidase, partial [Pirellulales bacterium]|nr:M56 family metallopeptidase [Pirellulales bacterium]